MTPKREWGARGVGGLVEAKHFGRRFGRWTNMALLAMCLIAFPIAAPVFAVEPGVRIGGTVDLTYLTTRSKDSAPIPNLAVGQYLILIDGRVSDEWRAYGEIEVEDIPRVTAAGVRGSAGGGDVKINRAYVEYNRSTANNFRFGRWTTPFGIWKTADWSILSESLVKPIEVQNSYFGAHLLGVEYFGKQFDVAGMEELEHVFFADAGARTANNGSTTDLSDENGIGGTLQGRRGELMLGATCAFQNREPKTNVKRKERMLGFWGEYKGFGRWLNGRPANSGFLDRLMLRSEAFLLRRKNRADGTRENDANSWYAAVKYDLSGKTMSFLPEDQYLYYRYDRGQDENRSGVDSTNFSKDRKVAVHTLTWGMDPHPNVRVKLELSRLNFDDPKIDDYVQYGASIGIQF